LKDYGKRLKWALKEKQMGGGQSATQSDLARALKVDKKGDSRILSASNNLKAARFLGISSEWLISGKGSPSDSDANELELTKGVGTIPLVSWRDLLKDNKDRQSMDQVVVDDRYSNEAFATTAPDDSMYDQDLGIIKKNSTLIIDPDVEPLSGNICLIRNKNKLLLRRYVDYGDTVHFEAANEKYSDLDSTDCVVIGTVISTITHLI